MYKQESFNRHLSISLFSKFCIALISMLLMFLVSMGINTFAMDSLKEGSSAELRSFMAFSPSEFTNGSVSIYINLPDNYRLLIADVQQPFSWDNGTTWTSDNYRVVTANGNYNVILRDKNGEMLTSDALVISNIDTQPPTINVISKNGVTVVSATDNCSGIRFIEWYGSASGQYSYEKNTMSLVESINLPADGTFQFKVTDFAGNTAYYNTQSHEKDPSSSSSSYSNGKSVVTPQGWFSIINKTEASATIYATVPSESWDLLASKPFQWNDGSWTSKNYYTVYESGSYKVKVKDINSVTTVITLNVSDVGENKSSSSSSSFTNASGSYTKSSSSSSVYQNNNSSSGSSPIITLLEADGKIVCTVNDSYSTLTSVYYTTPDSERFEIDNSNGQKYVSDTIYPSEEGTYTFYATNSSGITAKKSITLQSGQISKVSETTQHDRSNSSGSSSSKSSEPVLLQEVTLEIPDRETSSDTNINEEELEDIAEQELAEMNKSSEPVNADGGTYEGKSVNPDDYNVSFGSYLMNALSMIFFLMLFAGGGFIAFIYFRKKFVQNADSGELEVVDSSVYDDDYSDNDAFIEEDD